MKNLNFEFRPLFIIVLATTNWVVLTGWYFIFLDCLWNKFTCDDKTHVKLRKFDTYQRQWQCCSTRSSLTIPMTADSGPSTTPWRWWRSPNALTAVHSKAPSMAVAIQLALGRHLVFLFHNFFWRILFYNLINNR